MKIQCDVCEMAPACVICYADEAALCKKCDVEMHAVNKHQRLLLECLPNNLIISQNVIFVRRLLYFALRTEPIHSAGSQSANHQRFLATGIRVALDSGCNDNDENCLELPKPSSQTSSVKAPPQPSLSFDSSWAVDDLLQFSEFGSSDKKEQLEFGEFEWLTDMDRTLWSRDSGRS